MYDATHQEIGYAVTTPLPLSLAGYTPTEAAHRALSAIVAKYGQLCRAEAMEEAAQCARKTVIKYLMKSGE